MSDCMGDLAVSTKVDQEMIDYLNRESDRLGVSRAELIRRLFTLYRESRAGLVDCPHCDETVKMDVREHETE